MHSRIILPGLHHAIAGCVVPLHLRILSKRFDASLNSVIVLTAPRTDKINGALYFCTKFMYAIYVTTMPLIDEAFLVY